MTIAIIVIILAVAIPDFKNARLYAAETVVNREVQTIHQATDAVWANSAPQSW